MSSPGIRSGVFSAPFYANEEDPTLCIQRELEMVEHLDRLGFEEMWFGEHHSGGFELISSPELMIAAAAPRTQRIRLGAGVISLPYHNPLMVANRVLQLDHMTRGRLMFGVGPGVLISDATMLGIDPLKQRDRMLESLDVILRLFDGQTVTEKTEWYELKGARAQLRPFTRPHPEIAVASTASPSGARAAGRYGLSMLCLTAAAEGPNAVSDNWALAEKLAGENGHVMDRSNLRLVGSIHIAETREQARANMGFGLEKWLKYMTKIAPALKPLVEGRDPIDAVCEIRGAVIGTPDDVIEMIEKMKVRFGDFGCLLHMAHNWADWDQTKKSYELYARHVVPALRNSNAGRAASLTMIEESAAETGAARHAIAASMQKPAVAPAT